MADKNFTHYTDTDNAIIDSMLRAQWDELRDAGRIPGSFYHKCHNAIGGDRGFTGVRDHVRWRRDVLREADKMKGENGKQAAPTVPPKSVKSVKPDPSPVHAEWPALPQQTEIAPGPHLVVQLCREDRKLLEDVRGALSEFIK